MAAAQTLCCPRGLAPLINVLVVGISSFDRFTSSLTDINKRTYLCVSRAQLLLQDFEGFGLDVRVLCVATAPDGLVVDDGA